MNHREFQHPEEVGRQLLVAGRNPPAALQPADAPFNHVPPSVLPLVQPHTRLVASTRNHRLNPSPRQPLPDPWVAVSLVTRHRIRSTPTTNAHRVHQRFKARRLVALSRRHQRAQRHAVAIGHQMKLRAKASAGSSQGVVTRFCFAPFLPAPAADLSARMFEPSTSNTLQSIRPSSSSSRCSR